QRVDCRESTDGSPNNPPDSQAYAGHNLRRHLVRYVPGRTACSGRNGGYRDDYGYELTAEIGVLHDYLQPLTSARYSRTASSGAVRVSGVCQDAMTARRSASAMPERTVARPSVSSRTKRTAPPAVFLSREIRST